MINLLFFTDLRFLPFTLPRGIFFSLPTIEALLLKKTFSLEANLVVEHLAKSNTPCCYTEACTLVVENGRFFEYDPYTLEPSCEALHVCKLKKPLEVFDPPNTDLLTIVYSSCLFLAYYDCSWISAITEFFWKVSMKMLRLGI